jgi:hypothetical protein
MSKRADRKAAAHMLDDIARALLGSADVYRELLDERDESTPEELREEALERAQYLADACLQTWTYLHVLVDVLPDEAQPIPAAQLAGALMEAFAVRADDPFDDELPSSELVTTWVTHPLMIRWRTVLSGTMDHPLIGILLDDPAGGTGDEHLPNERQHDAAAEVAEILDPLLAGYRDLHARYASGSDVGAEATALAAVTARSLRRARGTEPFLFTFDRSTSDAMFVCGVLLASLLRMSAGPDDLPSVYPGDELELLEVRLLAGFRLRMGSTPE